MESGVQLSIVIPAFDEEAAIERVVRQHAAAARDLPISYEIVVCDDGSTDRTWEVLQHLSSSVPELRLLRHAENRGIPATMKELYGVARGIWTYFTPGDGQVPPDALRRMWAAREGCSVVVGRRHPRRDPAIRTVMARVYAALVRALFALDVDDVDGVKLYNTADLGVNQSRSTSVFFEAEQLIRLARCAQGVCEVDVPHLPRMSGRPKAVTWRSSAAALRDLAAFALRRGRAVRAMSPARLPPRS